MKLSTAEMIANAAELAEFIKKQNKQLRTTAWTNAQWILDGELAIFIGKLDDDILAGIKIRNDADWAEYDALDFPVFKNGDCDDVETTLLEPEEADKQEGYYNEIARWLLGEYNIICEARQAGEFKNLEPEEEEENEI